MMKLELKYLAPYLPYGIICEFKTVTDRDKYLNGTTFTRGLLTLDVYLLYRNENPVYEYIKPLLRPLSQLTREIEHNGERFVPNEWLHYNYVGERIGLNTGTWSHRTVQKLLEWHFDVFGLLDKDLALLL